MNVFSQWGLYCLCRFCYTQRASVSFLTPKKKMAVWIELASKLMSCWPAFFTFSSSKVFKTSGNSPKIWGRSKPFPYHMTLNFKETRNSRELRSRLAMHQGWQWAFKAIAQWDVSNNKLRYSGVQEIPLDSVWLHPLKITLVKFSYSGQRPKIPSLSYKAIWHYKLFQASLERCQLRQETNQVRRLKRNLYF